MIIRAHHRNSDLIGLYYLISRDFFIYPYSTKLEIDLNRVELTAYGSEMIGLYYILKDEMFVYPKNILNSELESIRNLRKEGMEIFEVSSVKNTLPNNIHIGERRVLVNPKLESSVKRQIGDITGLEVVDMNINNYTTVGSLIYENSRGFVLGYRAGQEYLKTIKELLGKDGYLGSLNAGYGFVRLCVTGNDKITVIGKSTTGIEEMKLREYLE
ncbi:MAG: hypothetical protein NZ908_01680 [Candidatus Micrarchaeota archaeon]|nr:hypothetical protein [Candidatus Micrarchaeota archaeon]MCX8154419.1 hypothetical protein [Candidatus Micrarchaeota archaeon]